MSFSPRPCAHCGGTTFHLLPDLKLETHKATTVMGLQAAQKIGWLRLTLVVCSQCTRTEMFTSNVAEMAPHLPGAGIVNATRAP
jgi:hypothetical protein